MYKFINGELPNVFDTFYTRNNQVHSRSTRTANAFRMPLVKSKLAEKFIKKTGVEIWTILTAKIDTNCKIGLFKKNVKNYLLQSYSEN